MPTTKRPSSRNKSGGKYGKADSRKRDASKEEGYAAFRQGRERRGGKEPQASDCDWAF